jgi:putative flippase GtrA
MNQLIRYIIAGGIGSLVFIVVGNLCEMFLAPLPATFIAYIFGGITGYILQTRVTFKTKAGHMRMGWKYAALTLLMLGYGEAITYCGGVFGVRYAIVNLFIAATISLFSFPLQKFWVYR